MSSGHDIIKLTGSTLGGDEIVIEVPSDTTVSQAAQVFSKHMGIDLSMQTVQLVDGTQMMQDGWVIGEHCDNESKLTLVTMRSRWTPELDPLSLTVESSGRKPGVFSPGTPRESTETPSLCLVNSYQTDHAWTSAKLEVPQELIDQATYVSSFMRLRYLTANGAYFNLHLATTTGETGFLEVKFDDSSLRGYGSATEEDFGINSFISQMTWFQLAMCLDRQNCTVAFSVDGQYIKTIKLNKAWTRLTHIELKGYSKGNAHWWSDIVVNI